MMTSHAIYGASHVQKSNNSKFNEAVYQRLDQMLNKVRSASFEALITAGFKIKARAVELCPVEFGNLRASSYVTWTGNQQEHSRTWNPEAGEQKVQNIAAFDSSQWKHALERTGSLRRNYFQVEVGFGAYYAMAVHERDAHHETGQKLFLLAAVDQSLKEIEELLRSAIHNAVISPVDHQSGVHFKLTGTKPE